MKIKDLKKIAVAIDEGNRGKFRIQIWNHNDVRSIWYPVERILEEKLKVFTSCRSNETATNRDKSVVRLDSGNRQILDAIPTNYGWMIINEYVFSTLNYLEGVLWFISASVDVVGVFVFWDQYRFRTVDNIVSVKHILLGMMLEFRLEVHSVIRSRLGEGTDADMSLAAKFRTIPERHRKLQRTFLALNRTLNASNICLALKCLRDTIRRRW